MISALALFNALLLGYSRIPFVLADDGLLPTPLAKLDVRGTPRTAIIVSAAFYSVFALVSFGKLVVADVLLYSIALFLEFGALIQLRKTEPSFARRFPDSAGSQRGRSARCAPMIVLTGVVGISFIDGEYGLPAIIGTVVAVATGPLMYRLARDRRTS